MTLTETVAAIRNELLGAWRIGAKLHTSTGAGTSKDEFSAAHTRMTSFLQPLDYEDRAIAFPLLRKSFGPQWQLQQLVWPARTLYAFISTVLKEVGPLPEALTPSARIVYDAIYAAYTLGNLTVAREFATELETEMAEIWATRNRPTTACNPWPVTNLYGRIEQLADHNVPLRAHT